MQEKTTLTDSNPSYRVIEDDSNHTIQELLSKLKKKVHLYYETS